MTVASHVALFDNLSEGRFLFGIGPGGLVSDAEMYGHHDPAERQRMMLAAIDIVLELWRGEPPYRFDNPWWDIAIDEAVYPRHGVGLIAKPLPGPAPADRDGDGFGEFGLGRGVRRAWLDPDLGQFHPLARRGDSLASLCRGSGEGGPAGGPVGLAGGAQPAGDAKRGGRQTTSSATRTGSSISTSAICAACAGCRR